MGNVPEAVPDGPELVGRRLLDRYRVDERIARGGMSIVFRGWDERLLRPVCIKLFCELDSAEISHQTVHGQFVREAYTLSQLNHPNTLRIYDFGRLGDEHGTPFQVSELAEGGTLRDLVRREGPLPPRRTLSLLEPVGAALSEAHGMGIVHRDIKPSNVLLCRAGTETVVKLADFGIARSPVRGPDPDDWPTLSGAEAPALYSLNWAAPEQLRRDPVGPATDVYSLGLLTTFVLSGRIVFGGDDARRLFDERRRGDELLIARLEALHLSPAVNEVLTRACRDTVAERIDDVELFIEALRAAFEEDGGGRPLAVVEPIIAESPSSELPHTPPASSAPSFSSPAQTTLTPLVTLASAAPTELTVGHRRLRMMDATEPVVLRWNVGGQRARVRVSSLGGLAGIHVKGLDCFIGHGGGRPSSGTSVVDGDTTLALISPGRQHLGAVRVSLGSHEGEARVFRLEGATVVVPLAVAPWAVVLDTGPQSPAVVLLRGGGSTHG